MEIDHFNDSLNKSINKDKMNVDNEFIHKSKSSLETDASNVENCSTSNSMNVENDKSKKKKFIIKLKILINLSKIMK